MSDDLNMHDSTLKSVRVCWESGTCIADIQHGIFGHCTLAFSAISHLSLPREQNWGRSLSINSFSMSSTGVYEIAMQSGDVIKIMAAGMTLTTAPQG